MSEEQIPIQPDPLQPPSGAGPSPNEQASGSVSIDASSGAFDSNYQRFADTASKQMNDAADAIRRGEFITDSVVDPTANADDRLVALLDYVVPVLLPVIVLLSESSKKRPFQRYHAVQSLALMLSFIALAAAVGIGATLFQIVPVIGWLIGMVVLCLTPIAYLMGVVALLYYGYQAYQGKRFAIPGLASFLRDQGWID